VVRFPAREWDLYPSLHPRLNLGRTEIVFNESLTYLPLVVTNEPNLHVQLDKKGVAWVDGRNVKVIELILDHQTYSNSPEEIALEYPDLSLAQVHAAFSYYYDHQEALDADLKGRYVNVEALRAQQRQAFSRKKLNAPAKPS